MLDVLLRMACIPQAPVGAEVPSTEYRVLAGKPYLSMPKTSQYENCTVIPSRQVPPHPLPSNPLSYSPNHKGGNLMLKKVAHLVCSSRHFRVWNHQGSAIPALPFVVVSPIRLSLLARTIPTGTCEIGPQPGCSGGAAWCWPINGDILAVVMDQGS